MTERKLPAECPKCGYDLGIWDGPHYKHIYRVGECLAYHCRKCGYETSLPCKDTK